MAEQVPAKDDFSTTDVQTLFTHFGAFSKRATYYELVREEAAGDAVRRWPLLAELQGIDGRDEHALDKNKAK